MTVKEIRGHSTEKIIHLRKRRLFYKSILYLFSAVGLLLGYLALGETQSLFRLCVVLIGVEVILHTCIEQFTLSEAYTVLLDIRSKDGVCGEVSFNIPLSSLVVLSTLLRYAGFATAIQQIKNYNILDENPTVAVSEVLDSLSNNLGKISSDSHLRKLLEYAEYITALVYTRNIDTPICRVTVRYVTKPRHFLKRSTFKCISIETY